MTYRIEVLMFPNSQILDVVGPLQVFASVNDLETAKGRPALYDPVVIGKDSNMSSSSGLALVVQPLPPEKLPVDTLVIPGGWGINAACQDQELVDWVVQRSRQARRTVSVCSGAFLLATAGLLDGRRAVTHWQRCAEFAERFPKVKVDPDPIFIQDGSIWTSAGVTAGIDLAMALVEADLGRDIALAVARQLVVFLKRPGGQSQFSNTLGLQADTGRFDKLHGWLSQNLHLPLSLSDLADQSGMSQRSFSRHYRQATGRTPARALEDLQIEKARRLLEQGLTIARTATRSGFGTEETMRRAFLRRLATSPQSYRDRFSA
ncbi:GlxA family transcriptional regulator [Roseibium algae]|uniref:GlxA family transcriptional regulator n=1 Tax=Roseibium algae TaxID=3123038 RepID=A0ABU8TQC5_9HYPH